MSETKELAKKNKKDEDLIIEKKTMTKKDLNSKSDKAESVKMRVEKVPSGVVVKKEDKEIISKIKIPKVVTEGPDINELNTNNINLQVVNEANIDVVKEQTIIDKIKTFLKKIVEMQEEAKESVEIIKESAKIKKETKSRIKKKNKEGIEESYLLEYYDLPYRYNETTVKILAQTPRRLFVYWDISDDDKNRYIETFGENFFNDTYPILLLYNEDNKHVREIPINDFANSWYIDIDNPKTRYSVQLGRKFKTKPELINIAKMQQEQINLQNDYLPFVDSNKIEAPNDHVLFENFQNKVRFRNVKTGIEFDRNLLDFVEKISKAYNASEFKKIFSEMNKNIDIDDDRLALSNPSSAGMGGNPTSTFK